MKTAMPFMKSCFKTLTLLSLTTVVFLTGCGGGAKTEKLKDAPPKKPVLEIQTIQLDQYKRIGTAEADGQFVILYSTFRNKTNQTIELKSEDIMLETITNKEEEYYTLPMVSDMSLSFEMAKLYGEEKKSKFMIAKDLTLYPKIDADRFMVFMLPSDATLESYGLLIKASGETTNSSGETTQAEPIEIKAPLADRSTVINDFRDR